MAEALQGAGEDAVHAVRGIQRAVGILEDDLQGADQCLGAAARRKGRDVRPVVEGATVGGAVQADEDAGEGRFSRAGLADQGRSDEHTSELQSLMRISYAAFCLKQKSTQ